MWPVVLSSTPGLTQHQAEKLTLATADRIGVFSGSPGTGKTYTLGALVKAVQIEHGHGHIAIACPTGKAAVRCTQAMIGHGLSLQARTIHSLLVVEACEGGGFSFMHNEKSPLPFRFIIIDEASMISTDLMASLLAARAKGTHILFVGDINQLPPVGHGAPLRDFIAAGLPYGELTEIKRNAGSIVRACAAIRDGKPFQPDEQLRPNDDDPKNLKLIPAGRDAAPGKILEILRKIRETRVFDPIWDVQVVVAVNARSMLSRKVLNKVLQSELNPGGKQVKGSPFRVGDKVIQLKNGFLKLTAEPVQQQTVDGHSNFARMEMSGRGVRGLPPGVDSFPASPSSFKKPDEKVFVANGDIGRVLAVEEKKTIVEFFNPKRVVLIPRGKTEGDGNESEKKGDDDKDTGDSKPSGTGCDLDLAFAVTAHKCQGSGFPCVIVCIDEYPGATGRFGICKREWLFTGISRAEKVCFLVGKLSIACGICRESALPNRKTFLRELIVEKRAKLAAERKDIVSVENESGDGDSEVESELETADSIW